MVPANDDIHKTEDHLIDIPLDENITATNNAPDRILGMFTLAAVSAAAKRSTESLAHLWKVEEEDIMKPGSALNFVIVSLLSFTAVKSQGENGFPFTTHSKTSKSAITCLLIFGFASAVKHAVPADSVYAIIAHLVRKVAVYILVGCLASLFYL